MFKLVILLLAAGAHAVPWRIVGGGDAGPGQFPYQVSIRQNGRHHCGGAIIDAVNIITAAHCVVGAAPWYFTVVAGSNKISEGGYSYEVRDMRVHASYDSASKENDIAILKLARPVEAYPGIEMINPGTSVIGPGVLGIASGWGNIMYPGPMPDHLQYAYLDTISHDECEKALLPQLVFESQLCTFTQFGQGTCHGDSGGPLVADGRLIGIVSWGQPCAIGYPDVFTRVSSFSQWIQSNV